MSEFSFKLHLFEAWKQKEIEAMVEKTVDSAFEVGFRAAWNMRKDADEAPYGFCPRCAIKVNYREGNPGGDSVCDNNHLFSSRETVFRKLS